MLDDVLVLAAQRAQLGELLGDAGERDVEDRAHARRQRADLDLRRGADDVALGGNELSRQRMLERRQAASRQQRVVAVDLGDAAPSAPTRRTPAPAGCRASCASRAHLALDLGVDLASALSSSHRPSILFRTTMRPPCVAASSPASAAFQTSRSVFVTPASAARMNSTACAFGSRLSVSSGSVPIAFKPGRVEDDQPLLQQRMREIDDRVTPARNVDAALVAALERAPAMSSSSSTKSPYLRAQGDRHALDLRHARERFAPSGPPTTRSSGNVTHSSA